MLEERSFDTGVVTINYGEGPASGPPMVLLHGGSARWQGWERVIPALVDGGTSTPRTSAGTAGRAGCRATTG